MTSTVPYRYPVQFLDLLKLDSTLFNVGAVEPLESAGLNGIAIAFGRKSLAGSLIGGFAETEEVIDYCATRNIKAEVELIDPIRSTRRSTALSIRTSAIGL